MDLRLCFGTLLLTVWGPGAYCQTTPVPAAFAEKPEALQKAFADIQPGSDPVTILLEEGRYEFDASGKYVHRYRLIFKVWTKAGAENWAMIEDSWAPWEQQRPSIRARVIGVDGSVRELDPKTIADSPVRDGDEDVLTDRRMVRAPLPGLQAGSIVEEEIVNVQTSLPLNAGVSLSFYFGNSVPVRHTRVQVRVPEKLPFRFKTYLLAGIEVNDRNLKGIREVTFDHGPMKASKPVPQLLPPDEARSPHVEFSTAKDWASLAAEYSDIVERQIKDFKPGTYLPDFPAAAGRETKINAIVEKLNREIRYTGIEFAEASIVPRTPSEVIQRKYGDCKDKSTLAVSLLRGAGIEAHVALLLSSSGRDIDPDLPGMGRFNHAIVYVPGSPDIWLDPTDPDLRLGVVSPNNQGRYALIARANTTGLIRTPELTAEQNRIIETREFTLAELGPAKVVEKSELFGTPDRGYRGFYGDKDDKALREALKSYIEQTYGESKIARISHGEEADLQKPYTLTIELEKAQRGTTAQVEAAVAIFVGRIAERLPQFFHQEPKAEVQKDGEEAPGPRTQDFYIQEPFTYEWRYRIVAPPGFSLRQLPPAGEEKFGPAILTSRFTAEGDLVLANISLLMPKRRFTAAEGLALRDGIVELGKRKPLLIYFDQIGETYLTAGKVKEALAEFDRLRALHPKEALHHLQTARALLAAGAGEAARAEAKLAVTLEPESVSAYVQLADILKHDLVGRPVQPGWDRDGAIAAYRKALELDPENSEARLNLAILLEYNPSAVRYAKGAKLTESIAEYKKAEDKLAAFGVAQNYPVLLFQAGMAQELRDYLKKQPDTELNQTLAICAEAVLGGSKAALERAGQVGADARKKVLGSAGQSLISIRRYDLAADLLEAAAVGSQNPAALANLVQILRKTKPVDDSRAEAKTPEDAVRNFFLRVARLEEHENDWQEPLSSAVTDVLGPDDVKELRRGLGQARGQLRASGVALEAGVDVVQAAMEFTRDGNDQDGYVVRVNIPNSNGGSADSHLFFVAREAAAYRIVALYGEYSGLARLILAMADSGKTQQAKLWLDRIRRELRAGSGDDPLDGPMFARLWQQGQTADLVSIRRAAASLATDKQKGIDGIIKILEADPPKDVAAGNAASAALTEAYLTAKQYAKAKISADRLLKALPESPNAFTLALRAAYGAGGPSAAKAVFDAALQRQQHNVGALRAAASIALHFGDVERSAEIEKRIVDSGQASFSDYNQLAWGDLMAGKVTAATLEAANRGMLLSNNQEVALMHTLAAVAVELGKEGDARATLLRRMEAVNADEPDDADWYVFGRIAEQYGLKEAAAGMYRRLSRPKDELAVPSSSYALAQRRLKAMGLAGN